MRTLWYLRHHYMVRLIDLGARHARARHHPGPPRGQPRSRHGLGVNTLMLDGDITLHGNPYALLKAPPLHHSSQIHTLRSAPLAEALTSNTALQSLLI